MVLMIQGLIILFSGALALMFHPLMERLYGMMTASDSGPDESISHKKGPNKKGPNKKEAEHG